MRILLITHFTRGDVQPFVALSKALANRGHNVRLASPGDLEGTVSRDGVDHFKLTEIASTLLANKSVREAIQGNYESVRGKWIKLKIAQSLRSSMHLLRKEMVLAAEWNPEVIVYHAVLPVDDVFDSQGIPTIPVCLQPCYIPTESFANPRISMKLPKPLNRTSYMTTRIWNRTIGGSSLSWVSDRTRGGWRSGRVRNRKPLALQAFSKHLFTSPPKYPEWAPVTGYWFLSKTTDLTPPPNLVDFLAAGPKPVYVGFGSMLGPNPAHTARTIIGALQGARARAVLASGWGGIDPTMSGDNYIVVEDVDHEWLFPQMSAIIHHGGAGTSGAALKSGRPQVVCPFFDDQPFFARTMSSLGVAPAPIRQNFLSAERLSIAIQEAVNSNILSRNAHAIGSKIALEDGLRNATDLIESIDPSG